MTFAILVVRIRKMGKECNCPPEACCHRQQEKVNIGLSIDGKQSFPVAEYESFIGTLQNQVEFYKKEHESLRSELVNVISENHELSKQMREALGTKLSRESLLSPQHRKEADMVLNLQRQLALKSQENKLVVQMWQMALKQIDSFEEAMRVQHENQSSEIVHKQMEEVKLDYSKAITLLQEKLETLKTQLKQERQKREDAEEKLKATQVSSHKAELDIEDKNKEIENLFEEKKNLLVEIERLKREIQVLEEDNKACKNELKLMESSRNDLDQALSECHRKIEELLKRDEDARDHVRESLKVIEVAIMEKDHALIREQEVREEVARLQNALVDLIDEAGLRVKHEVDRIKEDYQKEVHELTSNLKTMEKQYNEIREILERTLREKRESEEELQKLQEDSAVRTALEARVVGLEQKLQLLYTQLTDMERKNFQLAKQVDSAANDAKEAREKSKLELSERNKRIAILEQQLESLKVELGQTKRENIECRGELDVVRNHLKVKEQDLETTKKALETELSVKTQEVRLQQEEFAAQQQAILQADQKTAAEFQQLLEAQQKITKKWKQEVKSITETFERRIKELVGENSKFRKEKHRLQKELREVRTLLDKFESDISQNAAKLKEIREFSQHGELHDFPCNYASSLPADANRRGEDVQDSQSETNANINDCCRLSSITDLCKRLEEYLEETRQKCTSRVYNIHDCYDLQEDCVCEEPFPSSVSSEQVLRTELLDDACGRMKTLECVPSYEIYPVRSSYDSLRSLFRWYEATYFPV